MKTLTYYIIDSCSLIDLKKHNPMDIYQSVWGRVEKLIKDGYLIAPKEVFHEIEKGDDELKDWAKKQNKLFVDLDDFQIKKVKEIQAAYPSWIDVDKETAIADPFIIALALEKDKQQTLEPTIKNRLVISEEKLDGNKIKVPFVCQNYNIECITIFELFRKLGWTF